MKRRIPVDQERGGIGGVPDHGATGDITAGQRLRCLEVSLPCGRHVHAGRLEQVLTIEEDGGAAVDAGDQVQVVSAELAGVDVEVALVTEHAGREVLEVVVGGRLRWVRHVVVEALELARADGAGLEEPEHVHDVEGRFVSLDGLADRFDLGAESQRRDVEIDAGGGLDLGFLVEKPVLVSLRVDEKDVHRAASVLVLGDIELAGRCRTRVLSARGRRDDRRSDHRRRQSHDEGPHRARSPGSALAYLICKRHERSSSHRYKASAGQRASGSAS